MKKVLFSRAYALAVPTLFFAIFIAFAFFFASFSSAYPAEAAGETTEISTVEEMVAFSQAMQTSSGVGMRVELKADLDLSGSDFLPIGNSSHSFEGSFYGNDHTLIVDIENNGGGATGVFAYTGSGCYITGLIVRGSVSGNNYVGGIVGDADGGRIEKCVSFAEVTGSTYVGGLVGSCKGAVTACSSFATVRGRNTFGGAIGILQGSRSSLTESVFIGKVISNTGTTFIPLRRISPTASRWTSAARTAMRTATASIPA